MYQYMVVIEEEQEGGYSVYAPDLPGCTSQGETYEEALSNIQEAIELYLVGLKTDGLPPPKPRTQVATVQVAAA